MDYEYDDFLRDKSLRKKLRRSNYLNKKGRHYLELKNPTFIRGKPILHTKYEPLKKYNKELIAIDNNKWLRNDDWVKEREEAKTNFSEPNTNSDQENMKPNDRENIPHASESSSDLGSW